LDALGALLYDAPYWVSRSLVAAGFLFAAGLLGLLLVIFVPPLRRYVLRPTGRIVVFTFAAVTAFNGYNEAPEILDAFRFLPRERLCEIMTNGSAAASARNRDQVILGQLHGPSVSADCDARVLTTRFGVTAGSELTDLLSWPEFVAGILAEQCLAATTQAVVSHNWSIRLEFAFEDG
jgi:hypothetical protein